MSLDSEVRLRPCCKVWANFGIGTLGRGKRRRIALAAAVAALASAAAAQEQAAVEAGEAVYNNNCQTCHGDRLASTGQTFDLRRLTADDRARFDNSVRNGKNQMPPWKDVLSNEEIDQLWAYIRANARQ